MIPKIFKLFCMGLILALCLFFVGCKTQPTTIIQKEEIIWTYKDSIVTKDSVCYIPIERYVDIVPQYDTLYLNSSIAESKSWVDTTNHILRGEIKNKSAVTYQIKYIERVVVNDSIVEKEVPIPYEVEVIKEKIPRWAWITLGFSIIIIGALILIGYFKIQGLR